MNDRKVREFERRERDILDSTLELLSGEHWETLSVDKIARHTGIGKGTVYKHFECKDDIYAHLLLDDCQLMLTRFQHFAADECLTGVQQMRGMLLYAFKFHRDNVVYQHMYMYFKQKSFRERISTNYLQRLDSCDEYFTEAFGKAVCKGIAEGEVNPDMSQEVMMAGMSATYEGAMVALQEGGSCKQQPLETTEQKDTYINHVVDYMIAALTRQSDRLAEEQGKR